MHKKKKKNAGHAAGNQTILLAVTGISPAILTETVWALAEEGIVPDQVVAITTAVGRDRLESDLLRPRPEFGGKALWECLGECLERKGLSAAGRLRLDPRVMHRWTKRGVREELTDLRTLPDSQAAADFILEQVRSAAEIPDTRIVASIAGGRKTMGALLHAAMTLLGRETDRVTHVLIPEPYESHLEPRFYFPGQPGGPLLDPKGKKHLAAKCRIELADVPFVPIRNLFEREVVKKPGSFTSLAERCRNQVAEATARQCRLEVHSGRPEIRVNDTSLPLSAAHYALVRFLAERALRGEAFIASYKLAVDPVRARVTALRAEAKDAFDWRNKISPADVDDETRWITRNLSDLKAKLREAGPSCSALVPLLPESGRFSLDLPPRQIRLVK